MYKIKRFSTIGKAIEKHIMDNINTRSSKKVKDAMNLAIKAKKKTGKPVSTFVTGSNSQVKSYNYGHNSGIKKDLSNQLSIDWGNHQFIPNSKNKILNKGTTIRKTNKKRFQNIVTNTSTDGKLYDDLTTEMTNGLTGVSKQYRLNF